MSNMFSHADNVVIDDKTLRVLTLMAMERIRDADAVVCVCPNSYIGKGGEEELAYAISKCHKEVIYIERFAINSNGSVELFDLEGKNIVVWSR